MSVGCQWRERVALHAGGDLTAREARDVDLHLEGCEPCRELAEGLRADLADLRAEHERPIDAAHFVRLRARVMGGMRTESERLAWWKLGWIAAAALGAALLLLVSVPKQGAVARLPRAAPHVALPAAPHVPVAVSRPAVRRRLRHAARRVAPAPAQPMVVKLVTNDPNIVIYWITDSKTIGETP